MNSFKLPPVRTVVKVKRGASLYTTSTCRTPGAQLDAATVLELVGMASATVAIVAYAPERVALFARVADIMWTRDA